MALKLTAFVVNVWSGLALLLLLILRPISVIANGPRVRGSVRTSAGSRSGSLPCPVIRTSFIYFYCQNAVNTQIPAAGGKCPASRRATVIGRWFGGCAGSEVCCAPNDEPATVLYAPRAAWFVNRTIRAFAATHACTDPRPPSGALHTPDSDANHGSQVGPTKLPLTESEFSHPSLPVEATLRL